MKIASLKGLSGFVFLVLWRAIFFLLWVMGPLSSASAEPVCEVKTTLKTPLWKSVSWHPNFDVVLPFRCDKPGPMDVALAWKDTSQTTLPFSQWMFRDQGFSTITHDFPLLSCRPRWSDYLNLSAKTGDKPKPCLASVCLIPGGQCRLSQRMTVGSACFCPDPLGRVRQVTGRAQ